MVAELELDADATYFSPISPMCTAVASYLGHASPKDGHEHGQDNFFGYYSMTRDHQGSFTPKENKKICVPDAARNRDAA